MRRSKFIRPNPGKVFEDCLEQALIHHEWRYTRENVARMGVKSSPGRYDFEVHNLHGKTCIECKSTDIPSKMTLPPMINSMIKSHQLKALMKENAQGNTTGFLIEYRNVTVNKQKERRVYWLPIDGFCAFYAKHQPVSSILPRHCDEFGKRIEFDEDRLMIEMIYDLPREALKGAP